MGLFPLAYNKDSFDYKIESKNDFYIAKQCSYVILLSIRTYLGIITFHKDLRGPHMQPLLLQIVLPSCAPTLLLPSSVIKSISRYGLKDLTWFYGVPDPYELLRDLYKSTLYLSNKTLKGFAFRLPSRFWNAKKSKEHSIPSCFTY